MSREVTVKEAKRGLRERFLKKQKNKCAICGKDLDLVNTKGSALDHCHVSQRVRGVLCTTPCNLVLGLVREDPKILKKMIDYLAADYSDAPFYPKKLGVPRRQKKIFGDYPWIKKKRRKKPLKNILSPNLSTISFK